MEESLGSIALEVGEFLNILADKYCIHELFLAAKHARVVSSQLPTDYRLPFADLRSRIDLIGHGVHYMCYMSYPEGSPSLDS